MTDSAALYISIGSLVVAIASLGASIVSAKIAWDAKKQANKASALTYRLQAIDHIRNAIDDTIRHANITTRTTNSIQQAAHLSAAVFNSSITQTIVSGTAPPPCSARLERQDAN
jgi:K+-sensing histidine kinase KdpD